MSYMDELAAARESFSTVQGLDLGPFDNLTQSYGTIEDGFRIQLAEKDEMIQAMAAEISALKSKNYDLMLAAAPMPEAPVEDGDGDGEVDADGDGEDDDTPKGISALLGEDN